MTTDRTRYDVDHDLIAAGHPRLLFELDSYLESYPKHWNTSKRKPDRPSEPDQNPSQPETASEKILHTDVWRLGQIQSARQLFFQVRNRHSSGWWPEFANYDCLTCHHAMGNAGRSGQTYVAASGRGSFVASSLFARDYLPAAMRAEPAVELPEARVLLSALEDLERQLSAFGQPLKLSNSLRELFDLERPRTGASSLERFPIHVNILSDLLDAEKHPGRRLTWEKTVEFYFALQAVKRDCSSQVPPSAGCAALFAAAGKLGAKLSKIALTESISPIDFDPDDFQEELLDAQRALRQLTISDFNKSP